MAGAILGAKDKVRLLRESVSVSVNVFAEGKGETLAVNSFNVLSTLLTAGAATVDKASMFLPQEVPVLVREDRY